jgi:hypothetical protein
MKDWKLDENGSLIASSLMSYGTVMIPQEGIVLRIATALAAKTPDAQGAWVQVHLSPDQAKGLAEALHQSAQKSDEAEISKMN